MSFVAGRYGQMPWGPTWHSGKVKRLSPELIACLQQPYLSMVIHAANRGKEMGSLAASILDPTNTRAFVEQVRALDADRKTEQLADALASIYNPRRQSRLETEDDEAAPADERYPYIALSTKRFLEAMKFFELLDHSGRFLDVGCGLGEKPFLAYSLGSFSQCDGLEINVQTLAVADFLLATITAAMRYPINCFHGDALNYEGYGDYDVVYMFRPLKQKDLMAALFRHIAAQLRPGAIAFDVYAPTLAVRREEDGLYKLDPTLADTARWVGPIDLEEVMSENGLA